MRAKQRFYWLGVIESNTHFTRKPKPNWPSWARRAYKAGFNGESLRYC